MTTSLLFSTWPLALVRASHDAEGPRAVVVRAMIAGRAVD
jgi:hypothetical protein